MRRVPVWKQSTGSADILASRMCGMERAFGTLHDEFRSQAGPQTYCFAGKGLLGTDRMKRAFKPHGKIHKHHPEPKVRGTIHQCCFYCLVRAQRCKTNNALFPWLRKLANFTFPKHENYIHGCRRALLEQTSKKLVSAHKILYQMILGLSKLTQNQLSCRF